MTDADISLNSLDAYDFDLPEALIAHAPVSDRDASRLLICKPDKTRHLAFFTALGDALRPGDLLVFNDTRVLPCRLMGRRPTGGRVEIFALPPFDPTPWTQPAPPEGLIFRALVRASRRVRPGQTVALEGAEGALTFGERDGAELLVTYRGPAPLAEVLQAAGQLPLPPYILKRRRDLGLPEQAPEDQQRYQTVYAQHPGAVAAPTAGLHFTPALLDDLRARGVQLGFVTLHVGMGTFKPLDDDLPLSAQQLHSERYVISEAFAAQLRQTVADGGRIVAVGTTAARTLEAEGARLGRRDVEAGERETQLFIQPGFTFRLVDALVTNFHLPRSSLLVLISAFAGYELVRDAYRDAIHQRLRFFSYGDAMFLERAP